MIYRAAGTLTDALTGDKLRAGDALSANLTQPFERGAAVTYTGDENFFNWPR